MSIYIKSYEYNSKCIFSKPDKNKVKLHTLLKKNCKIFNKESITSNCSQFDKEMVIIRNYLNKNNIQFPLDINKIEIVKKELSDLILKNNMDTILIFIDNFKITVIFISENDNDIITNGIEKLIFKKSNINLLNVKY
jgi:hypothetical protein